MHDEHLHPDAHPAQPAALFGARLRQARQAANDGTGLGQSELAARIGVTQGAISDYERGRRQPNLDLLAEIGRVLGVSVDWLLTGAVTKNDSPATHTPASLLDRNLADLLGLAALRDLGPVGLLAGTTVLWAADEQPIAAESPAIYRSTPQGPVARDALGRVPALGSTYAMDRALARQAEAIAHYTGPAIGPLRPGDLLLVACREGRAGFRLMRRIGRTSEVDAPRLVVEEIMRRGAEPGTGSPGPRVTEGERVIGILRWV